MLRVAVLGAHGRMGATTCQAISDDDDLELVASLDVDDDRQALVDAGTQVCVDFTHPDSVKGNVTWLLQHGIHAVVGTSGMTDEDLADIAQMTGDAHAVVAPNFAIGAVLMMVFAQQAAVHLPDVEIIELHHDRKADAPSGTALRTASLIDQARGDAPAGTAAAAGIPTPCGPEGNPARGGWHDDIPVHSVRLRGLVAHQEIIFGGTGETLTIRHDSLDRSSFMPGVLLAVKEVSTRSGLTVGLEHLLLG